MIIRDIRWRDYEDLQKIHAARGYAFEIPKDPNLIEEGFLVESESGEIIAAGFAVRVPEIILLMGNGHPAVRLEAIKLLHVAIRGGLRRRGYKFALSMVDPKLKAFVRHLKRKFGWTENFTAFRIEIE